MKIKNLQHTKPCKEKTTLQNFKTLEGSGNVSGQTDVGNEELDLTLS